MRHAPVRLGTLAAATALFLGIAQPALASPANDDFAARAAVDHLPASDARDTTGATLEAGEPVPSCVSGGTVGATVWFEIIPSDVTVEVKTLGSKFDTVVALYSGPDLSHLAEVGCNDDAEALGSQQSIARGRGTPEQPLYVQIGGFNGASGNLKTSITDVSGDEFDDAISVRSLPFTKTVRAAAATGQPGEPSCDYYPNHTVWFSFTPAAPAMVTADTFGSDYDTMLSVYTGTTLSNLENLVCSDDENGGRQSRVTFQANAGTTHYFQIDSWGDDDAGTLVFSLAAQEPTPGDDFENALTIPSLPYAQTIDARAATSQPYEPSCVGSANQTIWFTYTPESDTGLTADTVGSDYDTVLSVYTGTSLDNLELAACNDNTGEDESLQSEVSFTARMDTTYYIQASTLEPVAETLSFNARAFDLPPNDDFANATEIGVPSSVAGTTTGASALDDEWGWACASTATVWYQFTTDQAVPVRTTVTGAFSPVIAVITSKDMMGCGRGSEGVSVLAQPDTTYYIQIGTFDGSGGPFTLRLEYGASVPDTAGAGTDGSSLQACARPQGLEECASWDVPTRFTAR